MDFDEDLAFKCSFKLKRFACSALSRWIWKQIRFKYRSVLLPQVAIALDEFSLIRRKLGEVLAEVSLKGLLSVLRRGPIGAENGDYVVVS